MTLKLLRGDIRLFDLMEFCLYYLKKLAVLQNLKHTR